MPQGGSLRLVSGPASRQRVEIRIEDTGVGIAPEHLSRIFDLYFTTKERGTGIGLSMVYRIIQMHDGEIEVQSTPGRGTTFRVFCHERMGSEMGNNSQLPNSQVPIRCNRSASTSPDGSEVGSRSLGRCAVGGVSRRLRRRAATVPDGPLAMPIPPPGCSRPSRKWSRSPPVPSFQRRRPRKRLVPQRRPPRRAAAPRKTNQSPRLSLLNPARNRSVSCGLQLRLRMLKQIERSVRCC